MKSLPPFSIAAVAAVTVMSVAPDVSQAIEPSSYTVYAQGLNGPRGLKFGPDGNLYIAEAGTGGTRSTAGKCAQVPSPVGPYTGGKTARISKISSAGKRQTIASGFPSAQDSIGDFIGVGDIEFIGAKLYALVSAGGCSHGNSATVAGVAEVDRKTGTWHIIANVSSFLKGHPAQFESADDFEPDGTLYSLIKANGLLYTVEPNHGQIFSVDPKSGKIVQLIDTSASQGHIVPTGIAERDGLFYVGSLNLFPIDPEWSRILTIGKDGFDDPAPGFGSKPNTYRVVNSKAGFTTVVAVNFGPDGLLYALELSVAPGFPAPETGKVVRVLASGEIQDVVTGLTVPTGMTFGPDGALYISNLGAAPPGAGQILRFDLPPG